MSERGSNSPALIRAILEDALYCHVGFVDAGSPVVIPMAFGLTEGSIVLHGLPASRLLARLRSGIDVCIAMTLFDGLVLAQSAFDHSMNYRSVTIFGRGRWLRTNSEKLHALRAISEQALPGRWDDVRPPSRAELRQTHVVAVPLDEAAAKIRSGPPSPESIPWDTWTGVLPNRTVWESPISDRRSRRRPPAYIARRRMQKGWTGDQLTMQFEGAREADK